MLRKKFQNLYSKKLKNKSSLCIVGISERKYTDMLLFKYAKIFFDSVLFIPISSIKMELMGENIISKYRETNLSKFDSIFLRVPRSSYNLAYMVLQNLPNTFKVQRPESFLKSSNRLSMFQFLSKGGIKVPNICFSTSAETAKRSVENMQFPITVRVPFGKEKTMIANNKREAKAMIDTLGALKQPIFLEQRYPNVEVFQLFVVGNDVIGSIKKNGKDFKLLEHKKIPRKLSQLATQACRIMNTSYAKVEIMNKEDPIVSDLVLCPSLDIIDNLSRRSIGSSIMSRIRYLTRIEKSGIVSRTLEEFKLFFKDIIHK